MSASNPPTYYFNGINYNDAFFTSTNNTTNLTNYLQRVGNPSSVATSTTFNGVLNTENIIPITNSSYNLGSQSNYFNNAYINNAYINNSVTNTTETQNDPLYLMNSVPTSSLLNTGNIYATGIGIEDVISTSRTSNIVTVATSLFPAVGSTIKFYGLSTILSNVYNGNSYTVLSSTSSSFTFAYSGANYSTTLETSPSAVVTSSTLGYGTITATSNASNITTITSTLNPGVGVTVVLYGLTTHTEYNKLQFVTLASTSTHFTFAYSSSGYSSVSDTGTVGMVTFYFAGIDGNTQNFIFSSGFYTIPTSAPGFTGNASIECGPILINGTTISPSTVFLQNGNSFGQTGILGVVDGNALDIVAGTGVTAIQISNATTPVVLFPNGCTVQGLLTMNGGSGNNPYFRVLSAGTLECFVGSGTSPPLAYRIDASSQQFNITGPIASGSVSGTSGSITLNGSTSGSAVLSSDSTGDATLEATKSISFVTNTTNAPALTLTQTSAVETSYNILDNGTTGASVFASTMDVFGPLTVGTAVSPAVNGSINLVGSSLGNTVTIQPPTNTSTYSLTLPSNVPTVANSFLTSSTGGTLGWQAPAGKMILSSQVSQSVASNSNQAIQFPTVNSNTFGSNLTISGTGNITFTNTSGSGMYLQVSGAIFIPAGLNSVNISTTIIVSGTSAFNYILDYAYGAGSTRYAYNFSTLIYLSTLDSFQLIIYQTSGSSINVSDTSHFSYLTMVQV